MSSIQNNFSCGQRVTFKHNDKPMRGTLTSAGASQLRIVGTDAKRYTTEKNNRGQLIDMNSVEHEEYGVFVFDTALDDDNPDLRQSAVFWKEFCRASSWNSRYERIHSKADLEYFLVGKNIEQPILIFNGHGNKTDGWGMSNGDTLNDRTFNFVPNVPAVP